LRFVSSFLVLLVLAAAGALPVRAATTLTCYTEIPATMLTTVTSASGYSGQVFKFKTTSAIASNGTQISAGTIGYGIVLSAVPASNRARNGVIVLEPRFLWVNNHELQVAGDPRDASILTHGASVVTQGAGAVPLPGFGAVFTEATHGSNITIGPGYNFHVVPIGNLQQQGPCVQKS
jgi:hypothetical protein